MKKINRPWVIVVEDNTLLEQLLPEKTPHKPEVFKYRGKVLSGHIFESPEDMISKTELFLYNNKQRKVAVFKKIRGTNVKCKIRDLQLIRRMAWLDTKRK